MDIQKIYKEVEAELATNDVVNIDLVVDDNTEFGGIVSIVKTENGLFSKYDSNDWVKETLDGIFGCPLWLVVDWYQVPCRRKHDYFVL